MQPKQQQSAGYGITLYVVIVGIAISASTAAWGWHAGFSAAQPEPKVWYAVRPSAGSGEVRSCFVRAYDEDGARRNAADVFPPGSFYLWSTAEWPANVMGGVRVP